MRVREREDSDLAACVQVLAAVYEFDRYPTTWPADPAAWLTPRNMAQAWVAAQNEIVGHVLVQTGGSLPGRIALIGRLCVAPSARGLGLGAALLERATSWGLQRGFELMLEVTADDRSPAIALYERAGWRRVETVMAPWTAADGAVVMMHRYVLPAPG
jgi:GNAT superfamily N-acetyltransferase